MGEELRCGEGALVCSWLLPRRILARNRSSVYPRTLGGPRLYAPSSPNPRPWGWHHPPVVMQKYVSWGATWWIRWCFRGRITCQSCRTVTQHGSPKYVCDHLWIWLVKVPKMVRQKTKHSQGYSCCRVSAGQRQGHGAFSCPRAGQLPCQEQPGPLSRYHQISRFRSSQGLAESVGCSAANRGRALTPADTCGLGGFGAGSLGQVL